MISKNQARIIQLNGNASQNVILGHKFIMSCLIGGDESGKSTTFYKN